VTIDPGREGTPSRQPILIRVRIAQYNAARGIEVRLLLNVFLHLASRFSALPPGYSENQGDRVRGHCLSELFAWKTNPLPVPTSTSTQKTACALAASTSCIVQHMNALPKSCDKTSGLGGRMLDGLGGVAPGTRS